MWAASTCALMTTLFDLAFKADASLVEQRISQRICAQLQFQMSAPVLLYTSFLDQ